MPSELSYLMVSVGVIVAFGNMLGLVSISKNAEKESEIARQEAEKNNQELQNQQAQLQENLKKVEQAQEEDRRRNWAAEGITQMSEILRSGKDSKEIFDNSISMIVNYVKANQGGLFVVDKDEAEENTVIRLTSCYAYSKKKFVEKEILPGQGLLGQAYLEGEYIHMTSIPQNYVTITSGLGEATPPALLIVPLKVNELTEGLLEIAAFHNFEKHEIELIQKLGENLASFIQNNRINERTKRLLEEAQQQAEELKAQEEEMHQNMEELAATQEEMHRKEKEYQRIIEDFKQEKV
jgi:transcriptional regulator with GAF, ATPase, and Fis domain